MKRTFFSNDYFNTTTIFYLLLLLPLVVVFFPHFQTNYEEDLLLLILFVYLTLRALEDKRRPIPDEWQSIIITVILGLIYILAWMGFVRGYLNAWGRWLALFPIFLIVAMFYRPKPEQDTQRLYRFALYTVISLTILIFGFLGIANQYKTNEDSFLTAISINSLIPSMLVFPILGCLLILSQGIKKIERGRDHLILLIPLFLITSSVWTENAKTWYLWYRAGELERAWTPFKFDAYSQPDLVAAAEKKPYQAVRHYQLVYDRIQRKGDIPKYLNWPFFMKFRMAYQAMRKEDALYCVRLLSPFAVHHPEKIDLIKRHIWHLDLFLDMQLNEPRFKEKERVLVDYAMSPDRQTAYALDCWGRVYSYIEDTLWLEWKPKDQFNDAQHLAILNDVFIVRRANGQFLVSKNTLDLDIPAIELAKDHTIIGMKAFRTINTLLLYTNYGELISCGELPKGFPTDTKLIFPHPYVADMELDIDERGYYLLDVFGAVHSNHHNGKPYIPHTSPPVAKELLPYWENQDMAADLELDPLGRGMYVYTRFGEVFTIAVKPYRETYRPVSPHPDRGVSLGAFADGTLYAFESNGAMITIP